jgi:hypothetical protein
MSFNGGVRPPTPLYCSAKAERCERSVAATFDRPGGAPPRKKTVKTPRSPAVGLHRRSSEREKSRRVSRSV